MYILLTLSPECVVCPGSQPSVAWAGMPSDCWSDTASVCDSIQKACCPKAIAFDGSGGPAAPSSPKRGAQLSRRFCRWGCGSEYGVTPNPIVAMRGKFPTVPWVKTDRNEDDICRGLLGWAYEGEDKHGLLKDVASGKRSAEFYENATITLRSATATEGE